MVTNIIIITTIIVIAITNTTTNIMKTYKVFPNSRLSALRWSHLENSLSARPTSLADLGSDFVEFKI